MGAFVNILVAPKASQQELSNLLSGLDPKTTKDWNLELSQCSFWQTDKGSAVWLNDHCCGYEEMSQQLSLQQNSPFMLCYIYDDDVWGYYFYDAGREVDSFCPIPDFLEEVSDQERQRLAGRSEVVAPYFSVSPQRLAPYLTPWEDSDEGEPWQMADFLAELGFPLPEEEASPSAFWETAAGKDFFTRAKSGQTDLKGWLELFSSPSFLQELQRLGGLKSLLPLPFIPANPALPTALTILWPEDQGAELEQALGYALPMLSKAEKALHASFVDYWQLTALAQQNSETSWDVASLSLFRQIVEHYTSNSLWQASPSESLHQRDPIGLQLLVCFLQQFSIPPELAPLIWQTLDLRAARYGRSAVFYGPLREQLLSLQPQLAEYAPSSFDALRVELIRYLAGHHHKTHPGPDADEVVLEELFARPDLQAALWDAPFVLNSFVLEDPYLSPLRSSHFMRRLCRFYQENPTAPYASLLLPRFENALQTLLATTLQREAELASVPKKVPGFSSLSFFLYWLNAFSSMMELPDLYQELRERSHFDLEWGRLFVGTDSKTKTPGFKKLSFVWKKRRFQIRFHLRYLEYFVDDQQITQPCFTLEELLSLKNPERFFYLLPLMIPVQDASLLSEQIAQRLAQSVSFLTEEDRQELSTQMAKVFFHWSYELDPCEQLMDWIWDNAERDPAIDPDDSDLDQLEALFGKAANLDELLEGIQSLCQQLGGFSEWLKEYTQEWLELEQSKEELSEEERRAQFIHSLPETVFWETPEKLLRYTCVQREDRLYPSMHSQDPDTGSFFPIGSVQRFLERTAKNKPASDKLRQVLLNRALGYSLELKSTSYAATLTHLPEAIYLDPDYSEAAAASVDLASLPHCLLEQQITSKKLDELLKLYQKGLLLRLELCWGSLPSTVLASGLVSPLACTTSLVLLRDGRKWACLCFDDSGHDSNQMIADPKGYLTSDCKSIERIPFGFGTLPAYAIFSKPEQLLEKLPALFRTVTGSRPSLQCDGIWSFLRDSVYYSQEKYILDKRLMGRFPVERAYNQLADRFYLKEYPTALDAFSTSNDLQSLTISGGNRDMPRFYLNRFFQNGLKKLIFHFGPELHLVFVQDGRQSMLMVLDDKEQTAYFAVADSTLCPSNPTAEPIPASFFGQSVASGLVFTNLLLLRGSADLLFAGWPSLQKILADSRCFVRENPCQPCPYDELRKSCLSLLEESSAT